MAEIPSLVWCIVGIFVSVVSFILGFIKPLEKNGFFQLMVFVGIAMFAFGIIKFMITRKSKEELIEERRHRFSSRNYEVEIDIDDYRNNPKLRQQVLAGQQQRYQGSYNPAQGYSQQRYPQQQNFNRQDNNLRGNAYQGQQMNNQQYAPQNNALSQARQIHSRHQSVVQRSCPSCGTPLLKEHRVCPICGTRV